MAAEAHVSTQSGTPLELKTAIQEFAADLRLENLCQSTIKHYKAELLRFERWVWSQRLDWQHITYKQLKPYVAGKTENTWQHLRNCICTLRRFYRWASENGYVAGSPAAAFKTPRAPKPQPRALTRDQVRILLAALSHACTEDELRDRALLLTGIYAGLRAAELGTLRWDQVDFAGGQINIRLSKMNHGRSIPLHPALKAVLQQWKEAQHNMIIKHGVIEHTISDTVYVFALRYNRPSTNKLARKVCQQWAARSGVHFTSHMLRHTFATWMLRSSGDMYAVSKALGHAQVSQTQIYVSMCVEDVRPALEEMPDLTSW